MKKLFAAIVFVMAALSVSYARSDITVSDAWVREAPPSSTVTAAYMIITNNGAGDDRLVGVASEISGAAEIHKSTVDDKGVASMKKVGSIDLPKGGSVELKPGGYHIMLIDLNEPPAALERTELVLDFEKAGEVKVEAGIKGTQSKGESGCH